MYILKKKKHNNYERMWTMKIDIRKNIIENFKDTDTEEMKTSIEHSISEQKEITLPGLGVFFEILWEQSDDKARKEILNIIKKGL